jgi:hypothetical protein
MAVTSVQLLADWNVEHQRVLWENVPNGSTGEAVQLGSYQDRSVQVTGTFGAGGSVSIQGSNDGGTTWATLSDPLGNALTFTAAGLKQVLELTDRVRCSVTAGDGTTSLDIHMFMRKDAK